MLIISRLVGRILLSGNYFHPTSLVHGQWRQQVLPHGVGNGTMACVPLWGLGRWSLVEGGVGLQGSSEQVERRSSDGLKPRLSCAGAASWAFLTKCSYSKPPPSFFCSHILPQKAYHKEIEEVRQISGSLHIKTKQITGGVNNNMFKISPNRK